MHTNHRPRVGIIYRNEEDELSESEITDVYNGLLDDIKDLGESIQNHQDTYAEVNSLLIDESNVYYEEFAKNNRTGGPIPTSDQTRSITSLNEAGLKYLMVHSVFWSRLRERIDVAKREFQETIQNIYVQMQKDFPDLEGLPIDSSVDLARSYPGKIVPKDL